MSRTRSVFIIMWFALFSYAASAIADQESRNQASSLENARAIRSDLPVSFERHQFVIERRNGQTFIDNQRLGSHPIEQHSSMNIEQAIDLVEHFDGLTFRRDRDFQNWVNKLRGPRTYTYDLVIQHVGDEVHQVPLVLLPAESRTQIDPNWRKWLDERDAENAKFRNTQSSATSSAQSSENEIAKSIAASSQSAALSLSVISGETGLWEVELLPSNSSSIHLNPGRSWNPWETYRNSIFVRTYGRTSDFAVRNAQANNPGYSVGSVRRLSRR